MSSRQSTGTVNTSLLCRNCKTSPLTEGEEELWRKEVEGKEKDETGKEYGKMGATMSSKMERRKIG